MPRYFKFCLSLVIFLASLVVVQTIFFYIWKLGDLQIALATVLAVLITCFVFPRLPADRGQISPSANETYNFSSISTNYQLPVTSYFLLKLSRLLLIILYIILAAKTLLTLASFQSFEAIRAPWEILPSEILIIYFILTLLLAVIFSQKKSSTPKESPNVSSISGKYKFKLQVTSHELQVTFCLLLASLHLFLTYSIAFFVYGLNFGFDPYIHQAAEKILNLTGSISPKPLLYVGHYSLVVWFHKISQISLITIDRLLAPVLTSIFLPPVIYLALTKGLKFKPQATLLAILTFPVFLFPFYFSVPQNLGNLFLLITILLSIILIKKYHQITDYPPAASRRSFGGRGGLRITGYGLLFLLGLATLFIHPFSGIPLLIYLTILTYLTQQKIRLSKQQKLAGLIVLIILGTAALPLAMILGGHISNLNEASFSGYGLQVTDYSFFTWLPFYSVYHLVYLFKTNHTMILAILASVGVWFIYKTRKKYLLVTGSVPGARDGWLLATVLILTFLIISIDVSLLSLIDLPIIAYELPEFLARFWQIALLFITPLILCAIARMISLCLDDKHNCQPPTAEQNPDCQLPSAPGAESRAGYALPVTRYRLRVTGYAILFFIALFSTIGFYLTYPRQDAFAKSRSYATSQHDLAAVRWIETDAAGRDYVVLANQSVSAAALQEHGFKKYFTYCHSGPDPESNKTLKQVQSLPRTSFGDDNCQPLFYYPIPTASPLYPLYLNMVYEAPTKIRLQEARELTGAKIVYFVVNDYWLDFDKIVAQAKKEFPDWQKIGSGKLYIFRLSL